MVGDVNNDGKLDAVVACEDHLDYNIEQVSWWDLTQFQGDGDLTSSILDGSEDPEWGIITWDADVQPGASLTVEVRASDDESNLGPFVTVAQSGQDLAGLIDPLARFLQYRLNLSTANLNVSPVFRAVGVEYSPPPGIVLSGGVEEDELVLSWTAAAGTAQYWVYGAMNEPYFEPGLAPGYLHRLATLSPLFRTWSSASGIGQPDSNWTYLVLAVDPVEQEICRSNRFGEHDFDLSSP